jgi:hypothetical protein
MAGLPGIAFRCRLGYAGGMRYPDGGGLEAAEMIEAGASDNEVAKQFPVSRMSLKRFLSSRCA